MSKNKENVPKIRFPGFTDPWEQRKLGELVQIKDSARIPNELWVESGVRYLRSSDLEKSGQDGELFISIGAYEGYKSKTGAPERGDVLFNSGGNIGLSLFKTDDAPVYVQGGAILYARTSQSKDVDGGYLNVYFSTPRMEKYIDISSAGGTIKHFTLKPANAAPIIFPNIIEQIKIGEFFVQLDNLITLHQRKLNNVQNLRAGLLQKMFPKNSEDFPEVRLPGFTDPWEQRTLEEVTKITMGQSPNSENYTDNPDDHILVQGNADIKNSRVVPRVWTTQVTKQAQKGDLILSVRAPVGDIGKTDYDVVLGRGVAAIKGNEFIFQSLGRMKQNGYWTKLSTGSTFESINSKDIKEAYIMIPGEEEQSEIGNFFANIDHLITLHQRKLKHLQEQKKSLLQQMFV